VTGQFLTIRGVNPEPWGVGTASAGRRDGTIKSSLSPNAKLQSYQNALREEVAFMVVNYTLQSFKGRLQLRFWFWRQVETGHGGVNRKIMTGNYADATNLQKSTEDALQGLMYDNDRETRFVSSEIMEQGPDVVPCIVIHIMPWFGPSVDVLTHAAEQQREFEAPKSADTDTSPWS
jgi:hypothetical protein